MKQHKTNIGVFDSGIGGLTVVSRIIQCMPHVNVVYFGDIARIPYGAKSVEVICEFTKQAVNFMLAQNIHALVIACNTITAVALPVVKELAAIIDIPVFNVIDSAVAYMWHNHYVSNAKRIAIIATRATVTSKVYSRLLNSLSGDLDVQEVACPLFVPFVEEGLLSHPALTLIARDYLCDIRGADIIVLGCTHYPLISNVITDILGDIIVINPSNAVVDDLCANFIEFNSNHIQPCYKFFVTDQQSRMRNFIKTWLNLDDVYLEQVVL
jgi:glutamate racemase